MSINLGIYDFFAYMIPGTLYLYVFNEFFRILGWKYVDAVAWVQPGQAPSIILFIPILVGAFVIGHIIDPLGKTFFDFFYRLRNRRAISERSLDAITGRYPNLNIQFGPKDWSTLFVLIRVRNIELSRFIDKFNADGVMLRNIAFGLVLLAVESVVMFLINGDWSFLIGALIMLILSAFAISRSNDFRARFFKHIYRASLEYGLSLQEAIAYNKKSPTPKAKR